MENKEEIRCKKCNRYLEKRHVSLPCVCTPMENNKWEENLRLWYKDKYPGEPSEKELDWIIEFISSLLTQQRNEIIKNTDYETYNEGFEFGKKEARKEIVEEILTLKEDWKPTEGYGSKEEKGFQKGITAQIKLKNKEIDTIINNINKQ